MEDKEDKEVETIEIDDNAVENIEVDDNESEYSYNSELTYELYSYSDEYESAVE